MLFLPLRIERALVGGEQVIYFLIGVAVDFAADAAFGAAIIGIASGRMIALPQAVEDNISVDEDDLHLGDLVFGQIQLLLQHF